MPKLFGADLALACINRVSHVVEAYLTEEANPAEVGPVPTAETLKRLATHYKCSPELIVGVLQAEVVAPESVDLRTDPGEPMPITNNSESSALLAYGTATLLPVTTSCDHVVAPSLLRNNELPESGL